MLISKKEFKQNDNDIYFMEVVLDKIVVNDNYEGILIFDDNLNLVKKLKLLEDMIVYKSYINKAKMEMLLFCVDNQCMVYIVLLSSSKSNVVCSKIEIIEIRDSE